MAHAGTGGGCGSLSPRMRAGRRERRMPARPVHAPLATVPSLPLATNFASPTPLPLFLQVAPLVLACADSGQRCRPSNQLGCFLRRLQLGQQLARRKCGAAGNGKGRPVT
eukprot:347075-Chlamydomonas_euryale.AAC.5